MPYGTRSTDSKEQRIHTKMAVSVFHRRKESDEEIIQMFNF